MRRPAWLALGCVVLIPAVALVVVRNAATAPHPHGPASDTFVGSAGCRDCHEEFYRKWAGSFHGLAMQPFTAELARTKLRPQTQAITIGSSTYRAAFADDRGEVIATTPQGEQRFPIQHIMGGKNVYYFLAPTAGGRLQVLPVAYDVRQKEWFDTTASAVRHFAHRRDEALDWRERPLTFNASCYGCHVSQLATNYDAHSDTYKTTWAEPGINCETCHGPGSEHVRVCRQTPPGQAPADLKIISTSSFSVEQSNTTCAPCHAKMVVMSDSFVPGDRYFDHYDLVTLEDPDFYPDGRDLGENYTYTLWRMSPCIKSGLLSCVHCHTSSGRYRFTGENANHACLPCHENIVSDAPAHTHHKADSPASRCVSCHMPMTEFARMRRSDHSMRPPAPAATMAFKSPNACNICHTDRDAAWADQHVRQWRTRDYQQPLLHKGGLIDAARRGDWARLPEMLTFLSGSDRDEVFANSLIRLLNGCDDPRKWPAIVQAMQDPSPLIRSSAVEAINGTLTAELLPALTRALRDDYRLVRVRAAAVLAGIPEESCSSDDRAALAKATTEFIQAMNARGDDHASHYNLGNFHMARQDYQQAISSFEKAARLAPENILPLVNVSLAYNALGRNQQAEAALNKALQLDPANAAANLDLGLLLAEMNRMSEAESTFRRAFQSDPRSAVAAYNLGVMLAGSRPEESLEWCRKAAELAPHEPRYAYTHAFYLRQHSKLCEAADVLTASIKQHPGHEDSILLLARIHAELARGR